MAALFGAMVVLAAVPSVSVMAVVARAATAGFMHGAFVTLGIVIADLFFILVAIFGLVLLAKTFGDLFVLIKYLGGAWLILLGVMLWRSRPRPGAAAQPMDATPLSSFMAGLLITLGDQKAILFYLGFFPAFLDLAALSAADVTIVALIAIVAVGGVKLLYAGAAARAGAVLGSRAGMSANMAAAVVMIAVGVLVIARTAI